MQAVVLEELEPLVPMYTFVGYLLAAVVKFLAIALQFSREVLAGPSRHMEPKCGLQTSQTPGLNWGYL